MRLICGLLLYIRLLGENDNKAPPSRSSLYRSPYNGTITVHRQGALVCSILRIMGVRSVRLLYSYMVHTSFYDRGHDMLPLAIARIFVVMVVLLAWLVLLASFAGV